MLSKYVRHHSTVVVTTVSLRFNKYLQCIVYIVLCTWIHQLWKTTYRDYCAECSDWSTLYLCGGEQVVCTVHGQLSKFASMSPVAVANNHVPRSQVPKIPWMRERDTRNARPTLMHWAWRKALQQLNICICIPYPIQLNHWISKMKEKKGLFLNWWAFIISVS